MREEIQFCFWGDNDGIIVGRTCISSCTVAQEIGMKNRFYCINGPEMAQMVRPKPTME